MQLFQTQSDDIISIDRLINLAQIFDRSILFLTVHLLISLLSFLLSFIPFNATCNAHSISFKLTLLYLSDLDKL
jgi:hypothetical protein